MARSDADPRQAVQLPVSGPRIDPRVQDPRAIAYAKAAQQRKLGEPAKYTEQVNGGPTPPIPRLDGDPHSGYTMAAHAEAERGRQQQSVASQGGIIEGAAPIPNNLAPGLMTSGILMGDILPDTAKADPAYRDGMGAAYAHNQPALAKKYGVIRQGNLIPPQQLFNQPTNGAKQIKALSPQTMEGLAALTEVNNKQQPTPDKPKEEEEKPLSEKEQKEILNKLDDFDFNRFRQAAMRDMLNNDKQKEIIEKRLKPLDIVDIIVKGRVTQTVPIVPGKFEVEFQSYAGEEDLILKRWVMAEAKTLDAPDQYFMDKHTLMTLTVAIRSVNKRPIFDCYKEDGNLDEDKFWVKYKMITRLDYHMLSSLYINWSWFDTRVRKLYVAEELGNG
jgi:hypothetical protein